MGEEISKAVVFKMSAAQAAEILRKYNEWRRGDHKPCGPPFTAQAIGEAINIAADMLERSIVKSDIESIIRAVTRETGVTDEEMTHHCRHREYTEARMIVCWLAYHYTQMTLTTIGKRLGRGHATASYYNMVVDSWLNEPRLNLRGARITTTIKRELDEAETDNLSCTT